MPMFSNYIHENGGILSHKKKDELLSVAKKKIIRMEHIPIFK